MVYGEAEPTLSDFIRTEASSADGVFVDGEATPRLMPGTLNEATFDRPVDVSYKNSSETQKSRADNSRAN